MDVIVKETTVLRAFMILSLAGVAIAGYLTVNHYQLSDASFCSISPTISCDIVNRSEYSEIFGVPVALIGTFGFLSIFILSYVRMFYPEKKYATKFPTYIFLLSIIGVAFASYLTYIEFFVIYVICPLCVASFGLILGIFSFSSLYEFNARKIGSERTLMG